MGVQANQALVIAIADHLSFAVHRHRDGVQINDPLAGEIGQLYPEHLKAGRQALDVIASW